MSTDIPLAPYSISLFYILAVVIGVLLGALVAFFLYLGIGLNKLSVSVQNGDVTIGGILYGRTIPAASLQADKARVVDISKEQEFQATKRTNGVGLSRLKYGWFMLRNGDKALMLVSDPSKAVYVPTTEGYSLIVSPREPDNFLRSLRK